MAVSFSDSAQRELDEIGSYIAEDNPIRAESFVGELLERYLGLSAHAWRYPVAVAVKGLELRRCPFGHYLIFYAILEDRVEVAHIFHASRDYMRLLFPDD